MSWLDFLHGDTARQAEDLAYPPTGGRLTLVLLGIVLPGVIAYFGVKAWVLEEAYWPGNHGNGVIIFGVAAQAFAVTRLSVACFCHFRWCWGLLGYDRVFEVGTAISVIFFLVSMVYAVGAALD